MSLAGPGQEKSMRLDPAVLRVTILLYFWAGLLLDAAIVTAPRTSTNLYYGQLVKGCAGDEVTHGISNVNVRGRHLLSLFTRLFYFLHIPNAEGCAT
jgi:hypothetical protein